MGSPGERSAILDGPASLKVLRRHCDLYEENPDYTDTLVAFREWIRANADDIGSETGLDLASPRHCLRLFIWLNQWENRLPTKNREHHKNTLLGLCKWWQGLNGRLPSADVRLRDFEELEEWCRWVRGGRSRLKDPARRPQSVADLIAIFGELRDFQLGARIFGPVAASKTLFVLRPNIFVAWDNPMMNALGYRLGSRERYALFLNDVRDQLIATEKLCQAAGYGLDELPKEFGPRHQECTAPELVNKYLWARTRPPKQES